MSIAITCVSYYVFFFFQAEDGIRYLVRSRGLGDVYKRQVRQVSVPSAVGNGRSNSAQRACSRSGCSARARAWLSLIHI